MPNAPVVFLVGTSTAGKSTICKALKEQDQSLPKSKRLNWQVWGNDLEMKNDTPRCLKLLEENKEFQPIRKSFSQDEIPIKAMVFGNFWDEKTNRTLNFFVNGAATIRSEDGTEKEGEKVSDEEFEKNLAEFLKETEGRFDAQSLKTLRNLSYENPNNFRKAAGFNQKACDERMFDRAITNSQNDQPTIIDVVPRNGGNHNIEEHFRKYAQERGFSCPSNLVLIHVPIPELVKRIDARNEKAAAEGNLEEIRNGAFPFYQYSGSFGAANANTSELAGEVLQRSDLVAAVTKFGGGEKEITEIAENLGFKPDEESINIGAKIKADAIYDNSKISNAEIAAQIQDWATKEMEKGSQEQSESTEQKTESWASKMAARAAAPTQQNEGR